MSSSKAHTTVDADAEISRSARKEWSERAADKQTPYLQITAALLQLSVGEITESVCLRMLVQQVRQTLGQMRRVKVNQPTGQGHINLRPIFTIIGFYRLVLAALLQTVGLLTHIFFRSTSLAYRPQSSLSIACVSNRSHGKSLVVTNFRPISIITHFTFLGTYRFGHIYDLSCN